MIARKIAFASLASATMALASAGGVYCQQTSNEAPQTGIVEIKFAAPAAGRRAGDQAPSPDLARAGVQTAQPVSISLNDAIRRALANNNSIEVSRGDVRFQATQVEALKGFYDPVFQSTPTYTRTSRTGSTATNDIRLNSGVSGSIKPGGGDYQFFFNNARTESAFAQAQATSGSVTASSGALYTSALGVQYNQPLLRNFAIDSTRRNIRIAKKRLEQNDADFRTTAVDTVNQVQRAYWDLVFALRDQQNQIANVNLARENLRQAEARIDAGAAAPLERAEVATELANREASLLLATQQVSIAENRLKQLVLRDPLSVEWSQSFTPVDAPAVTDEPVSMEQAVRDAIQNRHELKRLRLEREINEVDIRYFKDQLRPQVDLNTTVSLNGLSRGGANNGFVTNQFTGTNELALLSGLNRALAALNQPTVPNPSITIPPQPAFFYGGFDRSLGNLFRTDAPNFSLGVTISFPFRNRTAKANLAGARVIEEQLAARTRAQEQAVIVEVRNAVQAVETARQRVLTARRARENAEIQLAGEKKLYEAGRSTTFLLFQRENALTNARNAEIRSETDYNKAVADLQRATSTSLTANGVEVDNPVPQQ